MQHEGYALRLYDPEGKEMVARGILLPTVPPVGSRLSLPGGTTWEVTTFPEFEIPHPSSQAVADRDPIVIMLQVRQVASINGGKPD